MAQFQYFAIFAAMRTGSNFLETNLNALDGVQCFGEAFNPSFPGYPNRQDLLGVSLEEREADPSLLIKRIRETPDQMGGFRFFHDHDPRVLDDILDDPACAKIILTRNPLDSYVSRKIAQTTGQWKLTNVKMRRDARVEFDEAEFAGDLQALQDFRQMLQMRLQTSGQAAFCLTYDDLQSVDVLNGLARWLGVEARLDRLVAELKPQNPQPLLEKVSNPDDMTHALARLDWFDLLRTPEFEPRRGPAVHSYVAAARAPVLHMPVPGGPIRQIESWLASVDGAVREDLLRGMSRKEFRGWLRSHPGHRRFTVISHPLVRAHRAFCERILASGPEQFKLIRRRLQRGFGMKIPDELPCSDYTLADHRAAFEVFLTFVKANIVGQTSLRIDPNWCSQAAIVQGFSAIAPPDLILREHQLADGLSELSHTVGFKDVPLPAIADPEHPFTLADIYDSELEAQIADVYQRDYQVFGFGPWG